MEVGGLMYTDRVERRGWLLNTEMAGVNIDGIEE